MPIFLNHNPNPEYSAPSMTPGEAHQLAERGIPRAFREAQNAPQKPDLHKPYPTPSPEYRKALEAVLDEAQALLGVLPADLYNSWALGLEEKVLAFHEVAQKEGRAE